MNGRVKQHVRINECRSESVRKTRDYTGGAEVCKVSAKDKGKGAKLMRHGQGDANQSEDRESVGRSSRAILVFLSVDDHHGRRANLRLTQGV